MHNHEGHEENEYVHSCACAHRAHDEHHKDEKHEEVGCGCGHSHEHDHKEGKAELIKIIISSILFVCAITLKINDNINLVLLVLAYLIIGYDIILNALKSLFKGHPFDENFLMTLATIGAWGIGEYNEAVAVMLFYKIGEYFQGKAISNSRKSIADLMDIRPESANLKVGEDVKTVSPEDVKVGDIVVVKAGEKIPLDGIILEGHSFVDTVALTGESVPREVEESDDVLAGMINTKSLLTIQVTKEFNNSTVSRILELVENTASQKAPTEKFITKFARIYTPIVVFLAIALAILPPLIVPNATFAEWIYKALVCLVISCPCALVLSVPLSYFAGIGCASKKGILVKGSNYLEALNDLETLVVDKTGTLTEGVFQVTEVVQLGSYSKEEMIKYCAHAESFSNHPIATSILNEYTGEIEEDHIQNYEEISGHGIKANIFGKEVLAGNIKLLNKENIPCERVNVAGTIVYLAIDKEYAGYFLIADKIKADSNVAIKRLKNNGVRKIVMLTGDNSAVAEDVAKKLGLRMFKADLLPNQKVEEVEKLLAQKSNGRTLGFVGNGINDAPVLARADIGIAMGGIGSDAAIEASDVVIMTDELSKIVTAVKIAKRTRKIVMQNIALAMVIKIGAIILGLIGKAAVWHAVIADVGVTIVAVINSLRCLKIKD
ncbi:MAG: cadmium-translocating P-type ATPase [Clostridia bacterium]|nr:cadmium-translocating P-type ATPase [Clostridia bacterium]